jgi:hypothetical protein
MSHGRRAVRYQCSSRDDESNDYGESEGQCGPYQEPQGFKKMNKVLNGRDFVKIPIIPQ